MSNSVMAIEGASRGLGTRLGAAGDGNGDGDDDLLVAAGGCDTCEGAFWLPGGPGGPLPSSAVRLAEPSDSHFDFGLDVADAGDLDADGWPAQDRVTWACDAPEGYRAPGPPWDCDDSDDSIHPDAKEIADDAVDQDCDGQDVHTSDDTGPPAPGEDEPAACGCRTRSARAGIGLLLLVLPLVLRRRPLPWLAILAGCGGSADDDTGGTLDTPFHTVFAAPDGTAWLGGERGRVAHWSTEGGLVDEPALQPGGSEHGTPEFLNFQGALWAVHDQTASLRGPEGWQATGLEVGETAVYGYEGSLLGLAATGEALQAFTALPPNNDPDCFVNCSTTWDLSLHAWDGVAWVRVHHLTTDGRAGPVGAVGEDLLLGHGATLWRWGDGALIPIDHPLGHLHRIVGTPDGTILALDRDGALALGDLAGLDEVWREP